MKKTLLLFFFSLAAFVAKAGIETTDQISISELTVAPGGDVASFEVSLQGSDVLYSAYEVTLQLPEGLTVDYTTTGTSKPRVFMSKPSLYPYTEEDDSYTHTLSCSYGSVGERMLKVMCYSTANEDFTATSGTLFRVYVKASPFMKPGTAKIVATNVYFATKDEVQYDVADSEHEISVSDQSTVSLNVSADIKWNTCVLPFSAQLPAGVRAFSGSRLSEDYLYLTEASSLQAFTPYLLLAENGCSGTLQGTVDPEQYVPVATDGYLNGAITPQQITQGYVMQNKGEGTMFYNVNGQNFVIPQGKCWLASDKTSSPQAIRMGLGTTGIDAAPAPSIGKQEEVFTLDGKRVSNPLPGYMYIINGKKVLKLK
ncbi:MAG: hypothetical protein IKU94_09215 [Bacteroidaceae bacterium]|nr:hypothetical protein [Bacteroidaceae bacterium]